MLEEKLWVLFSGRTEKDGNWVEMNAQFPPSVGKFCYRPKYDKSYANSAGNWMLLSDDSNEALKCSIEWRTNFKLRLSKKKLKLNFGEL